MKQNIRQDKLCYRKEVDLISLTSSPFSRDAKGNISVKDFSPDNTNTPLEFLTLCFFMYISTFSARQEVCIDTSCMNFFL